MPPPEQPGPPGPEDLPEPDSPDSPDSVLPPNEEDPSQFDFATESDLPPLDDPLLDDPLLNDPPLDDPLLDEETQQLADELQQLLDELALEEDLRKAEEELQQAEEELSKLSKTLDEPVGTPSPGGTAGEELAAAAPQLAKQVPGEEANGASANSTTDANAAVQAPTDEQPALDQPILLLDGERRTESTEGFAPEALIKEINLPTCDADGKIVGGGDEGCRAAGKCSSCWNRNVRSFLFIVACVQRNACVWINSNLDVLLPHVAGCCVDQHHCTPLHTNHTTGRGRV